MSVGGFFLWEEPTKEECVQYLSALSLQDIKESCFSRGMMALLVPLEMKIPLGARGK